MSASLLPLSVGLIYDAIIKAFSLFGFSQKNWDESFEVEPLMTKVVRKKTVSTTATIKGAILVGVCLVGCVTFVRYIQKRT